MPIVVRRVPAGNGTYEESGPMHVVAVRFPESVLQRIDETGEGRSRYIRRAVYEALDREGSGVGEDE